MHKHTWTDFNDQISFVPSDFPEGTVRIILDNPDDFSSEEPWIETTFSKEEFESFVAQIKEKMGWHNA